MTPISGGSSDRDFNMSAITTDADLTITENMGAKKPEEAKFKTALDYFKDAETVLTGNRLVSGNGTNKSKPVLKRLSSLNLTDMSHQTHDGDSRASLTHTNIFQSLFQQRYTDNSERYQSKSSSHLYSDAKCRNDKVYDKESSKNVSVLGSDKWGSSKEKFLDNENGTRVETREPNEPHAGAVIVKESFIEVPRMTRISKSFHGKTSSNSNLNISTSVPRRASDSVPTLNKKYDEHDSVKKAKPQRSKTEDVPVKSRFTTTLVDEAEHAASYQSECKSDQN